MPVIHEIEIIISKFCVLVYFSYFINIPTIDHLNLRRIFDAKRNAILLIQEGKTKTIGCGRFIQKSKSFSMTQCRISGIFGVVICFCMTVRTFNLLSPEFHLRYIYIVNNNNSEERKKNRDRLNKFILVWYCYLSVDTYNSYRYSVHLAYDLNLTVSLGSGLNFTSKSNTHINQKW